MKICRYMSVREYEAFKKGKTIRPVYHHELSEYNSMVEPSVCFFPYVKGEVRTEEQRYAMTYIAELLSDYGGGYLVIFEANSKRLKEGCGIYMGRSVTEYYMPCYNKKLVKFLKVAYSI